jgi:hypothetical protein
MLATVHDMEILHRHQEKMAEAEEMYTHTHNLLRPAAEPKGQLMLFY